MPVTWCVVLSTTIIEDWPADTSCCAGCGSHVRMYEGLFILDAIFGLNASAERRCL